MGATDRSTLRALRRRRRDRRLGDIEWFDVAYRAYLYALGGTIVVVWASDLLDGLIDDVGRDELLVRAPGIAGFLAALAIAFGLRQGAEGGPISIEPADVRHLLMAPIDRRLALAGPVVQRMRAVAFIAAVPAAILGQLVGRELVGSRAAWAGAAALFGAAVGAAVVAVAVVAHAARIPRWAASALGFALVLWQGLSAVVTWRADVDGRTPGAAGAGPFDLLGSVALWGVRQRGIDVIALVAVALAGALAVVVCDRLRTEDLERRGALVTQLRFAATMQDIRTVVQLRRQLGAEVVRARPWFAAERRPATGAPRTRPVARPTAAAPVEPAPLSVSTSVVLRRGVASIRRFPAVRLARIGALSAAAGAAAHASVVWTPIFLVAMVLALYVIGLEIVEPLSQEVDRPDRTDALPVDRAALYVRHLVVPAIALVGVAAIGAAVVALLEPDAALAAVAIAVPVTWAGAIGAVATTVSDAARPASVQDTNVFGAERLQDNPFSVPEFAGVGSLGAGLLPLVWSAIAAVPVVAVESTPTASTVFRVWVGVSLCLGVLVWWILRRDRWAVATRRFFADGRAARGAA